jgi:glutaminyl-peptide cyclotransferase
MTRAAPASHRRALAAGLALLALAGGGIAAHTSRAQPASADPLPVEHARPLHTYPHDPRAFTEGLFIDNGQLYESTGEPGRSGVRHVDLATGRVLEQATIPAPQFGEGIAPWQDRGGQDRGGQDRGGQDRGGQAQIISLTWRDGVGYRWARHGLTYLGRFNVIGEGWGLTRLGPDLVMSDGSASLQFIDPATFRLKRRLAVTANGTPVDQLNELEVVDGEILANIWQTDRIARIDPATGHVTGWIDVSALHQQAGTTDPDAVANGIAWDAPHRRLYVTGKDWPFLFEIAPPKGK